MVSRSVFLNFGINGFFYDISILINLKKRIVIFMQLYHKILCYGEIIIIHDSRSKSIIKSLSTSLLSLYEFIWILKKVNIAFSRIVVYNDFAEISP